MTESMAVDTLNCYFGLKGRVQGGVFVARRRGNGVGSPPSWTTDLIALPADECPAKQTGPDLQLYIKADAAAVGVLRSFQFDEVDTSATFNLELQGKHYLLQVAGTNSAEQPSGPGHARFLAGLAQMVTTEYQSYPHSDSAPYARKDLREIMQALRDNPK